MYTGSSPIFTFTLRYGIVTADMSALYGLPSSVQFFSRIIINALINLLLDCDAMKREEKTFIFTPVGERLGDETR